MKLTGLVLSTVLALPLLLGIPTSTVQAKEETNATQAIESERTMRSGETYVLGKHKLFNYVVNDSRYADLNRGRLHWEITTKRKGEFTLYKYDKETNDLLETIKVTVI